MKNTAVQILLVLVLFFPFSGHATHSAHHAHHYLQQINLYRLADSTFTLSQAQEDSLYLIAGGTTTQAPLAKALLTVLRDTIFPIELPDEPVQGRSVIEQEWRKPFDGIRQLLVVPNPASVEVKVFLPDEMPEATISVFDIAGREVMAVQARERKAVLPVQALHDGIYLLKAYNGEIQYQAKLLIQH